MGMFAGKGLNTKSSSRGGKFIPPGKYRVKIKASKGRRGYRGESAIVEYEVVQAYQVKRHDESLGPKSDDNAWVPVPNPEEVVPAGSEFSIVYALKHGDVALGNIADYIRVGLQEMAAQAGTMVDVDDVDFDDDDADAVWGEENKFQDLELHLHAFMIKTVEKGQPFTKCVWSSPSADEAESAAA